VDGIHLAADGRSPGVPDGEHVEVLQL